jgi:transcription-repair coupling factor (superfamily II helicase)
MSFDLPVVADLPPDYVPGEVLRIEAHRRLAVTSHEQVADIRAESRARYRTLPKSN